MADLGGNNGNLVGQAERGFLVVNNANDIRRFLDEHDYLYSDLPKRTVEDALGTETTCGS